MSSTLFKDEVAIVTGAGQGIGFEICRKLASQGASVVLNDIDQELTVKAVEIIKKEGGRCSGLPGDASRTEIIHELVKDALSRFGKLTIAIANAGITTYGDFFNYTREAFNQVMNLNLGGSFFLAQAAAAQMRIQGSGGTILFMSSVVGHQAHKNLAAYAISKAGLEMLAKNLVAELSPFKITVNALAPGATLTERTLDETGYENTWSRITPMGRPASVLEIADAALFLVSPGSRHITGQTLVVDGGWTSVSPSPFE